MSLQAPINLCPVIGVKARLLAPSYPRKKPQSLGERSLTELLQRRKEQYLAYRATQNGMKESSDAPGRGGTACIVLPQLVQNPISAQSELANIQSSESLSRVNQNGAAKSTAKRMIGNKSSVVQPAVRSPSQLSSTLLTDLDCSKLAEHVVSRAKVRLRRQQRKKKSAPKPSPSRSPRHDSSSGSIRQSSPHLPKLPTLSHLASAPAITKTNAAVNLTAAKIAHTSPVVTRQAHSANSTTLIDISSLNLVGGGPSKDTASAKVLSWSRVKPASKVIYLSETHSLTPRDTDIPNVPPTTPNEAYFQHYKFVPSLADLKSQRQLKTRLLEILSKLKEKAEETCSPAKEEERRRKEAAIKLKAQQRAEIYALNRIMARLEEENFQAFMSAKV